MDVLVIALTVRLAAAKMDCQPSSQTTDEVGLHAFAMVDSVREESGKLEPAVGLEPTTC